jgi:hypothetical protein
MIALSARAALLAVMLQIAAIDHHFGVSDVVGIEGSSAHTMHCHGNTSGCADAAGSAVMSLEGAFVLPRQTFMALALTARSVTPAEAVVMVEGEPPRL